MTAAGAQLFRLADRGVIEVTGADRVRWLDGMLTNDVAAASAPGAGCAALLLTRQGRIIALVHLLSFAERIWLETALAGVAPALAALEKLVVADDVVLADASPRVARLALEGETAPELLATLGAGATPPASDHFVELEIAGAPVVAAAWSFGAGPGFQLFAPVEAADAVAGAVEAAGAAPGDAALFELLRIEAGTPRFGAELDETVLPDEARLGDAVSTTKGCYIGQEVVARLRSRERIGHLLVGLRLSEAAAPGAELAHEGRKVGEVTSAVASPRFGEIALAYVRAAHSEPGTVLELDGREARVSDLPFS